MRRMKWNRTAATAAFLMVVGFLTFVSTPALADGRWGADYFPNVVLTTQDGKKVHFYDDLLKGKMVVIEMIYTHCVDACPLETARLAQIQKMLGDRVGKEVFFYSISIDPTRDTPKVLKEYADKYHAGPGWLFLTGKKSDIDLIGQKLGLYNDPDPNDRDGHAPAILIGNEPGHQWMRNSATDNARFISILITDWLTNWQNAQASGTIGYDKVQHVDLSDKGRYIFGSQCAACHTIGHGDKIGPDLQGVAGVRDHDWLVRFITSPEKVISEKDPIATALYQKYKQVNMPNLHLSPSDMKELVDFLERQSAPAAKEVSGVQKPADGVKAEAQPLQ